MLSQMPTPQRPHQQTLSPTQIQLLTSHLPHKTLDELSYTEWGYFTADKVAGNNSVELEELGLSLISSDIFARNVLLDIPCTNSWYWGDAAGTPLLLVSLSSQFNEVRHQLYITDRDNYRANLPQPLPAYWYDNSRQFSSKVYELKHSSSSSLSNKVRLIMSKGWHGGNRIKSKKASPEDQFYLLCEQDDSQSHWLHHCPHPPSALLRAASLADIAEHIAASGDPEYGTACRTELMTTAEPEWIWTGK